MIGRVIFALWVALLVPVRALAQGDDPCPRAPAGSTVQPPPELFSRMGKLDVDLNYFTTMDDANRTLFCFDTAGGRESPTLYVRPGDRIRINLTDKVPNPPAAPSEMVAGAKDRCGSATMTAASVNMHFHGTNTSPVCHSDEVIHTLVNSGDTFRYNVDIPGNEPPGLYWYHPHVHGISESAVLGGASGVIVVEGVSNIQPKVAGLPQRLLIIRDQDLAHPNETAKPKPAKDLSLNYIPVSYPNYRPAIIKMNPGVEEFWRVTNAGADTIVDLQVKYDGNAQLLEIVDLDGVPTGSQDGTRKGKAFTQRDVLIPPASRAEFIVTGPSAKVKSAVLATEKIDTGPAGDSDPERPLAMIETTGAATGLPRMEEPRGPPNVQRFEGLADAKPTAHRKLYFSESPNEKRFYITVDGQRPELFHPDEAPKIVTTKGAVEDWTIENRSAEVHEFHIHQLHFLVLAVNGGPVPKSRQQFRDTYQVGYWSGSGPYPSIKVRMDFRGRLVGDFVYHCHILNHEDGGMMAIIRVQQQS
ncbi:MAG TPA: multicopper oxidase domain-containing protein [Rhizomicrobium sp.]